MFILNTLVAPQAILCCIMLFHMNFKCVTLQTSTPIKLSYTETQDSGIKIGLTSPVEPKSSCRTVELTPEDDHLPVGVLGQSLVACLRRESNGHTETPQEEANALATCVLCTTVPLGWLPDFAIKN